MKVLSYCGELLVTHHVWAYYVSAIFVMMEYLVLESDLELEDVVSAVASAIYCWSNGLIVNVIELDEYVERCQYACG